MAVIRERGWDARARRAVLTVKLSLWCLNPAAAFGRLTAETRAVVLTSGGLSAFVVLVFLYAAMFVPRDTIPTQFIRRRTGS